ncbi:MAG: UbiA family prenyltransferase, partial [bacterium]
LYYILGIIPALLLCLYFYEKNSIRFLFYVVRFPRLAHFWLMFLTGIFVGFKGNMDRIRYMNSFDIFFILLSLGFLWCFSVISNDIFDITGDMVSLRNKPLAKNIVSPRVATIIASFFLILGLAISALVDYKYFALSAIFTLLYWIYSAPPVRLKNLPIISTFIIATASVVPLIMGNILAGNRLVELPSKLVALLLICFTLAFNAKDLKDVQTDRINKTLTLPVLLGEKRGRLFVGILIFIAFVIVPFILGSKNPLSFVLSFLFGFTGLWIATRKKVKEGIFFILYFAFVFVIFILIREFNRLF